jgi:hypothetical protein
MKNVVVLNAEKIDAYIFGKLFGEILSVSFSTEKEFLASLSEKKHEVVYVHNIDPSKMEAFIDLKAMAMVKDIKCFGSVCTYGEINDFDYSDRYQFDVFVWEELDWSKFKDWFLSQMELAI